MNKYQEILKQQKSHRRRCKNPIGRATHHYQVAGAGSSQDNSSADAEIQKYYSDNKDKLSAPAGQIRAAHILVETEEEGSRY